MNDTYTDDFGTRWVTQNTELWAASIVNLFRIEQDLRDESLAEYIDPLLNPAYRSIHMMIAQFRYDGRIQYDRLIELTKEDQ